MKNKLIQVAILAFFTTLFITSCMKEPISSYESDINQEVTERGSEGPLIQTFPASNSLEDETKSSDGETKKLFCCDVQWVGYQSPPFSNQAGFTWTFNRYQVPSANAYRHNFTIFRNDVLFWAGTFAATSDPNCPSFNIALVWPNGLGNCCGVFSATMADEYRVGSTWYTCDADHGQFNYFPAGCGWCE